MENAEASAPAALPDSIGAPAKSASKKGKGTGKRYTEEQRREILKWLEAHPGHGSIGKAIHRFGVSYISLRNWMKKSGVARPERKGAKAKPGRPAGTGKRRGRPPAAKAAPQAVFSPRTKKKIQKALARMGHGIEMLAEAFSHIT